MDVISRLLEILRDTRSGPEREGWTHARSYVGRSPANFAPPRPARPGSHPAGSGRPPAAWAAHRPGLLRRVRPLGATAARRPSHDVADGGLRQRSASAEGGPTARRVGCQVPPDRSQRRRRSRGPTRRCRHLPGDPGARGGLPKRAPGHPRGHASRGSADPVDAERGGSGGTRQAGRPAAPAASCVRRLLHRGPAGGPLHRCRRDVPRSRAVPDPAPTGLGTASRLRPPGGDPLPPARVRRSWGWTIESDSRSGLGANRFLVVLREGTVTDAAVTE
jgi:hypothetical protein